MRGPSRIEDPERRSPAVTAASRSGVPFFIVGCDRSGNTLLQVMLNRHPQVAIPGESHFIPRLWARRRRYGRHGRVDRLDLFLADLWAQWHFRVWNVPLQAIRLELENAGPDPRLVDAIEAAFRAYARQRGRKRWGDKTPRYVDHVPLLAQLFPSGRFVHLIRDGRDVALSMLDMHRLHRHAATAAYVWARKVGKGREAGRVLGPARYHELHYEDLVTRPEEALREVCSFLDLPFDPSVLEHSQEGVDQLPESVRWMHRRLALPPTQGLRDWRSQMDAREVAEFEAVAGRRLVDAGYPRARTRTSLHAWFRAWFRFPRFVMQTLIARGSRRPGRGARARAAFREGGGRLN